MAEIGASSGTGYPSAIDTNSTPEVDSPSASKTLVRAATPNDLAAAVIAVQTELGTNPRGAAASVKAFLQAEHTTAGLHTAFGQSLTITETVSAGVSAVPLLLKSSLQAEKARFVISSNANLNLSINRDPVTPSQDDAGSPSWVLALNISTDNFILQRSPAGSTSLTTLLTLNSSGAIAPIGGFTQPGTGGESLKIIRGIVNANGSIAEGTGFTVSGTTTPYTITFTTAFSDVPSVVATVDSTAAGSEDTFATVEAAAAGSVDILIYDISAGADADKFHFIAIGPA